MSYFFVLIFIPVKLFDSIRRFRVVFFFYVLKNMKFRNLVGLLSRLRQFQIVSQSWLVCDSVKRVLVCGLRLYNIASFLLCSFFIISICWYFHYPLCLDFKSFPLHFGFCVSRPRKCNTICRKFDLFSSFFLVHSLGWWNQ